MLAVSAFAKPGKHWVRLTGGGNYDQREISRAIHSATITLPELPTYPSKKPTQYY